MKTFATICGALALLCSGCSRFFATGPSTAPLFVDDRGKVVDPYQNRQVKNTVTANSRDVQKCYNAYLEKMGDKVAKGEATGDGEVVLDWSVRSSGRAEQIRVVFSGFQNSDFENCLIRTIESWKFPRPPADEVYTDHHFRFSREPMKDEAPIVVPFDPAKGSPAQAAPIKPVPTKR